MYRLKEIKEKLLPTKAFDLKTLQFVDYGFSDVVRVFTYENYLIAEPMTAESLRRLKLNPYNHLLRTKDTVYSLYYFPEPICSNGYLTKERLTTRKYIDRYDNLLNASNHKYYRLLNCIQLPAKDLLNCEYTFKEYNKETDFGDDLPDTTCSILAKVQKPYIEINRVSLNYNTLLILDNAKANGNKALYRYQSDTKTFYTDCIINYIIEHSDLLNPDFFKFDNAPNEVRIPVRELLKLYPHRSFTLQVPEGVQLTYVSQRKESQRISKNDIAVFIFSKEFLSKFRVIISKSETNRDNPQSFIKVPMFFVLQALQNDKLTSRGLNFLLWFLTFYRMKSPKIFHSLKTIIAETGMDITHGYRKPLAILQRYFNYLYDLSTFANIQAPVNFTSKDIDNPPLFNGALLQVRKPKLRKG